MSRTYAAHFSKLLIVSPFKKQFLIVFILGCSLVVTAAIFLSTSSVSYAQASRFIPMPPVFASGGLPQQVVPADVNGDGIADLITGNANGVISVLIGKGSGAFAAPITIASLTGGRLLWRWQISTGMGYPMWLYP